MSLHYNPRNMRREHSLRVVIFIASGVVVWSGIRPYDPLVWLFEISLGLLGTLVLLATCRRFRFSNLVYVLVCVHIVVLAVGAKYTYAEMPLFNWLRDTFDLSRNHYDRVGHFMQGFVPVVIVREFLLRMTSLQRGKMLAFLAVCVCLALSAFYELIEMWMVLLFYPDQGPEWLGIQGDAWDAQWDMTMALCGALLAYGLLHRLHDRSLKALRAPRSRP